MNVNTQRRHWQALIVAGKEHAEVWLRYHRAHAEDSEEITTALKAAYVSGFLSGAQHKAVPVQSAAARRR